MDRASLCDRRNTRTVIGMKSFQTLLAKVGSLLLMKIRLSSTMGLEYRMVPSSRIIYRARYPPFFFFPENMDGHQAMLVYIENHLQQDRMWQISLKAQQTPVKIPDVMRQYRTISRVFRELVGKKLDNGHTIFKVSKLFPYKLNDDFLSEYDTEPYMRNHGN